MNEIFESTNAKSGGSPNALSEQVGHIFGAAQSHESTSNTNGSASADAEPAPIRVWWGYKRPDITSDAFEKALGNVFVPATVQQMQPLGLDFYQPALLPDKTSSDGTSRQSAVNNLPDEIAIVGYKSPQRYQSAGGTTFGREYQLLHRAIFNFDGPTNVSSSDFPIRFEGHLDGAKPYTLFPAIKADMQSGTSKLFVGTAHEGESASEFRKALSSTLSDIQAHPRQGLDAVIVRASDNFFTYWEHYKDANNADTTDLDRLTQIATPAMRKDSAQAINNIPVDGNAQYTGVTITPGASYNLEFPRKS